jgi:3-hydroxyphenylacetate 6-hydroxylase
VAWSLALLAERTDIQDTAIAEIRKVYDLTTNPLCDAYDDQGIPYIVALVKELLRYYTVLRLALPRATIKDIVWEGKKIPAGSVVFLNAWACNMDEAVWKDPEVFRPERWLAEEAKDVPMFTYGLGYRMCAGSLLANREMYTIYLRLLAAYKIEDVEAEDGGEMNTHPVKGVIDPTQLVSVPKRYKVRVVPRDAEALRRALDEAEGDGEKQEFI